MVWKREMKVRGFGVEETLGSGSVSLETMDTFSWTWVMAGGLGLCELFPKKGANVLSGKNQFTLF